MKLKGYLHVKCGYDRESVAYVIIIVINQCLSSHTVIIAINQENNKYNLIESLH